MSIRAAERPRALITTPTLLTTALAFERQCASNLLTPPDYYPCATVAASTSLSSGSPDQRSCRSGPPDAVEASVALR